MKIVMTGSSGFIGKQLSSHLEQQGHTLVRLSRSPKENEHFWDPATKQLDPNLLNGADIVINLAGENILGRWNQEKMDRIRASRLEATQLLCDCLLTCETKPKLFINASAIGYYGDRGEEVLTESSSSGHGFLAEVCREWERIPETLQTHGVRVAYTRFGLVLGPEGGALKLMEKPFKMGMGGTLGKGEQIMSWIALDDVISAFDLIITNETLSGPINFTAPNALSNLEFTKHLASAFGKSAPLPIPKFIISTIFGSGAEVFLSSTRAHPQKLLDAGFAFAYPTLDEALKKYLPIKA